MPWGVGRIGLAAHVPRRAQRIEETADPAERARLFELVAWARLLQNDPPGARVAVAAMGAFLASPELRARLAAVDNNREEVVRLLEPLVTLRQLQATAVPLLVSAVRFQEGAPRVVALFRALLQDGKETPKDFQAAVHEAIAQVFHDGEHALALDLCVLAFERLGASVHAFNAACCLARLGRLDEGLEWLRRSVNSGYSDVEAVTTDVDLAPLRALPGFTELVASMTSAKQ